MTLRSIFHRSPHRVEAILPNTATLAADRAYDGFLAALAVPLAAGKVVARDGSTRSGTRGEARRVVAEPAGSGCRRWKLALPEGVGQLRIAYFGVQRHSPADASMRAAEYAIAAIREVLFDTGAAAIESSEVLAGHDMPGSWVQSVFWIDPQLASTRLAALDLGAVYAALGPWRDSVGLWSEQFTTSVAALQTCYTGPEPVCHRHGLAQWGRASVTRDADDAGGGDLVADDPSPRARPAAIGAGHERPDPKPTPHPIVPFGYGEHLSGRNPNPLVHVRSGHDGSDCGEVEAGLRERGLQILIDLGLQHLWRKPVETGTCGLRQLVRVDDEAGRLADVCVAGFFSSAPELGAWMAEHDAHLADFRRLLDQEGLIERNRRLRTYQEISRIEAGDAHFEYVNCGPRTGVIRFIELERRRLSLRPDLA